LLTSEKVYIRNKKPVLKMGFLFLVTDILLCYTEIQSNQETLKRFSRKNKELFLAAVRSI
jgi:hypothetical protein